MPHKMDLDLAMQVLEGLMRYSSVILFVKNAEGRYLAVSDGWEAVTGTSSGQTLQRDDVTLFGPEVGGAFREADLAVMESDRPMQIEESLHKADGTEYFISTKFPLRNTNGETFGVCGVATDITPLRRMQSALNWIISDTVAKTGERLFQVFTQHIANLIGADYCLIGRLERDQRSLQTLALAVNGEIVDNQVFPIVDSPCANVSARQICIYERNVQAHYPHDPTLKSLNIQGYAGIPVFGSGGSRIGMLVALFRQPLEQQDFVADLFKLFANRIGSEMERLEHEQDIVRLNASLEKRVEQRTRELQLALSELEMFNHCVSHDLKAPLRAIKGFADILLEDEMDNLSADGREMLSRVINAANRVHAQINALGKLVKLDSAPLVRKSVDLSEMSRRIGDVLKGVHRAQHARLDVQADMHADCDPALTELVLTQLLGNALKFSRLNPEPVVSLHRIERDHKQYFVVEDNGVGFDMTYANKLFYPFQRLHAGNGDADSTGIGLASVARIIQRHGGEIWAEGDVGQGARFGFCFNGNSSHT